VKPVPSISCPGFFSQRDSTKPCFSVEAIISQQDTENGNVLKKIGDLHVETLEGLKQADDKRSVAVSVKDASRATPRADLRDGLDRILLLSVLLFAFWATAWIFLVGFGGYYFNQTSYHPVGVNFWLFNTTIPIFPGLGLLGALVGIVKRDRPVSFLVGFLPNVLNFIIYESLPSLGQAQMYSDVTGAVLGFATLLGAGVGLGLLGLAGSYYGEWREDRHPRNARFSLLLLMLGFLVWGSVVWVWPGYGAAVPGLGLNL
jgi:hypothetical protein